MTGNKAKAQEYRQSEKGRLTRQQYNMRPEVKAHKTLLRQVKQHIKGKA